MSNRLLSAVLFTQCALLGVLLFDRLIPSAHATSTTVCEVVNWPDAIASPASYPLHVVVERSARPLPVVVKDWDTTDRVNVGVSDWSASRTVDVAVQDWDTSDRVKIEQ